MTNKIKNLFQLDPSIVFLNHGSFGAVPTEVFTIYQDWQRQLEYHLLRVSVQGYNDARDTQVLVNALSSMI